RDLHSFPTRRSSDLTYAEINVAKMVEAVLATCFQPFIRRIVKRGVSQQLQSGDGLRGIHQLKLKRRDGPLGDALRQPQCRRTLGDRKSTRLNSSHVK